MMNLPKHLSLFLTHNEHKNHYSADEYLGNHINLGEKIDPIMRTRMIDLDSIWELQWYPTTPGSFYKIWGATLEDIFTKIDEFKNKIS